MDRDEWARALLTRVSPCGRRQFTSEPGLNSRAGQRHCLDDRMRTCGNHSPIRAFHKGQQPIARRPCVSSPREVRARAPGQLCHSLCWPLTSSETQPSLISDPHELLGNLRLMWRVASTSLAKSAAVSLLTSGCDSPIVGVAVAIEDIRACEHRRIAGTLGSMNMVSEAPAPGAGLITRRSLV